MRSRERFETLLKRIAEGDDWIFEGANCGGCGGGAAV